MDRHNFHFSRFVSTYWVFKLFNMDAKELRIGNWVSINPDYLEGDKLNPFKITCIDEENGVVVSGLEVCFEWNDIIPIPLTPEILEKAGFVSIGDEYHFKIPERGLNIAIDTGDYSFYIYDTDESYRVGRYHSSSISELKLHQLQNLYYALTGEELQIKF